ncbi:MAG: cobalamin biosynthesis protein P47K [Planctomycetes bacterium]|nr:cobalamin biosynthesis protein P47K [Planctomycetota bacterium]
MSNAPRFIMIGGFLGAGKTTTIARLARRFQSLGKRVVVVTNDQTTDLVDTNLLRSQGFDVGEVAGSCFCCNFNALTATVEQLSEEQRPDVIIVEPVGSCTDLVATVIRPLQQIYAVPLDIAPYGVIVKPSHGGKILRQQANAGFSPKAEYIFRKQIEEADFVIINRIDELPQGEVAELASLLESQFPGRPVIRMSAKTGDGFDAFCAALDRHDAVGRRVIDVDYDVYAEGEAELGWLNSQLTLKAQTPIDLDGFLLRLLRRLRDEFARHSAETAHLKVIGLWEGLYGVANLVSSETAPVLSLASDCHTRQADVVVNARVALDPDTLAQLVRRAVADEATAAGAVASINTLQSFRPGRPVPTHRIVAAS